jgi:uncharacterized lipoprotein YajG
MRLSKWRDGVWLVAALALAGCATNRSVLKVASPTAVQPSAASATLRAVVVRSVKDERVFEENPSVASTPSLGFGGAASATEAVKARAVARKRGGFGKAMGDVLLDEGQTVAGVVRDNLVNSLQAAGYRVVNSAEPADNAITIDVAVKKYWAYFRPGFWQIALDADIETDITVAGAAAPLVIAAHVEDRRQAATERAWLQVLEEALAAYRKEAVAKLPGLATLGR